MKTELEKGIAAAEAVAANWENGRDLAAAVRALSAWAAAARKAAAKKPRRAVVHVRGGVAYCNSKSVRIVDHDNR